MRSMPWLIVALLLLVSAFILSTPIMNLLENGNVGIGTTSPGASLTVSGRVFLATNSGGVTIGGTTANPNDQLRLEGTFTGVDQATVAQFIFTTIVPPPNRQAYGLFVDPILQKASSGTHVDFASARIDPPTILAGGATLDDAASLYLPSPATTGGTRNYLLWVGDGVARFDGNVGIGTKNPVEKLDVNGKVQATAFITTSSRAFKENIRDLSRTAAMKTLHNLKPVQFFYKADAEKDIHMGFISEEVPDLVATPDRKGVRQMDIIAVLTKVVQEQERAISALEERLKALEE